MAACTENDYQGSAGISVSRYAEVGALWARDSSFIVRHSERVYVPVLRCFDCADRDISSQEVDTCTKHTYRVWSRSLVIYKSVSYI